MSVRDDERLSVNPTRRRHCETMTAAIRSIPRDVPSATPTGFDRRRFMMRSAVVGAAAVMTGCSRAEKKARRPRRPPLSPPPLAAGSPRPLSADLNVVKKEKGPVMTTLDEFYKVGPGPSSSHTIGPMRITYDFYQRCTKLPADQLAKATALKVHLYGSLSATGKGHGTERAALAGLVGKEPATVDPAFLDSLARQARSVVPGEARRQDLQSSRSRTSSSTRSKATSRIRTR